MEIQECEQFMIFFRKMVGRVQKRWKMMKKGQVANNNTNDKKYQNG
jgi:hypothetical protein